MSAKRAPSAAKVEPVPELPPLEPLEPAEAAAEGPPPADPLAAVDPADHADWHALAVDFKTPGLTGTFRRAEGVTHLVDAGLASAWPPPVPEKVVEPYAPGNPRPALKYVPAPPPGPPAAAEWDEPVIRPPAAAVPFPLDVFPAALADLVAETAAALPCAPDLIAGPALVAAGGAVGRSLVLAVKESSWFETASLYLAVCAVPGSTKSEALRVATDPISRAHSRDLFEYQLERELAKEMKRVRDAERKAKGAPVGPDPDDDAPALRRVKVGDTTTEKLAVILSENSRGVTMVHDELTGWIAGMNQYKGGSGADRQFYLSVWSGASISIDRKNQTDGIPIHIPHPFLSIVGNATPEKLTDLNPGGKDDGFLDRILFSYPDEVKVRWSDAVINPALRDLWSDAVGRLFALPLAEVRGEYRPTVVRFSRAGRKRFASWYDAHCEESEALDFPRHLKGPWAKMRGYCARIALALEAIHWAYDATAAAPVSAVELATVERAIKLVDYFKAHVSRAHQVILGRAVDNPDAQDVLGWAVRRGKSTFTAREAKDVFRRRCAAKPDFLESSLSWLVTAQCLRRVVLPPASGPGRPPGCTYEISPICLKSAREIR